MGVVTTFMVSLFAWMPIPLQVMCYGVVTLFILFTILHIVAFVLDLIPFL